MACTILILPIILYHTLNLIFLSTVKYKNSYFSTSEIQGVDEARKLQQEIVWSCTSNYKGIVWKQISGNCKVIVDNIIRAELVHGLPTPILQWKMTRVKPKGSKTKRVPLPLHISQDHKDMPLYIDFL